MPSRSRPTLPRPRRSLAGALCAVAVLAGACGEARGGAASAGAGVGNGSLALAFMGPLTGDGANIGHHVRNGAQLAVEEAMASGLPVPLELRSFDTQFDPAQARTLADRIMGRVAGGNRTPRLPQIPA